MLATELWDHQKRGVDRIDRQDATMLAWEMGAGKTLAVVAYVERHKPFRTLILCPKSVIGVWPGEFSKHWPGNGTWLIAAPENPGVKKKAQRLKVMLDESEGAYSMFPTVAVTNHESAWREPMSSMLLKTQWDLVVVDESHRAKAPGGKFSMWLSRLRRKAAKRVMLTGTPMPHSPLDVYAQYRFLDPTIYGNSNTRFKARYAIMGGYAVNGRPVQILGYQNMDELQSRFYSIADRVIIDEVLDLPDEIHVERSVVLPVAARRSYDEMERELVVELKEGTITAANAMVKVGKLQQIAAGAVRDEDGRTHEVHTAKRDELVEVLEDLPPGEPVAVFCTFKHSLEAALAASRKTSRPTDELHGAANTIGAKWDPQPGAVAAIQYQSGGVGIDLTACRYVVLFDQTYRLGDYLQMIRRALRPGQDHHVRYIHLLARDTVDRKIRRALAKRQDVIEAVLRDKEVR